MTSQIKQDIDDCISKNKIKRRTGLGKQQMLKEDIYKLLISMGYCFSRSNY